MNRSYASALTAKLIGGTYALRLPACTRFSYGRSADQPFEQSSPKPSIRAGGRHC